MQGIELPQTEIAATLRGEKTVECIPWEMCWRYPNESQAIHDVRHLEKRDFAALSTDNKLLHRVRCRYAPGETVYLQEAWWLRGGQVLYQADASEDPQAQWAPAHLMPITVARATILIREIRCHRLQDVVGADVLASCAWRPEPAPPPPACGPGPKGECVDLEYLRNRYREYAVARWGQTIWAQNPMMWRLSLAVRETQKGARCG